MVKVDLMRTGLTLPQSNVRRPALWFRDRRGVWRYYCHVNEGEQETRLTERRKQRPNTLYVWSYERPKQL